MIENTKRETITRTKAAEILGCSYQGVYQYISQGKLTEAPKEADGYKRVYLDEVMELKHLREQRKVSQRANAGKRIYKCTVYNPFDVMVFLDPDDDTGLVHELFVSRKAFDGLMTGIKSVETLDPSEVYLERVGGKLPLQNISKLK